MRYLLDLPDGPKEVSGEMLIGRHSACELRVANPRISRRHAKVGIDDKGLWIESLASANATKVNGHHISERTVLREGDTITLGPVKLEVLIERTADDDTYKPVSVPPPTAEEGGDSADSALRLKVVTPNNEIEPQDEETPTLVYRGRQVKVDRKLVVGRHRDCDIQIRDPWASRQHLFVDGNREEGIEVEDFGSANGSQLNGEKLVGREPLFHGDRITIGSSNLVVQWIGGPERDRSQLASAIHAGEPSDSYRPVDTPDPEAQALTPTIDMESLIGRTLSGFRIDKVIGEGSLAVVHAATQLNLERQVAFKVFKPDVVAIEPTFSDRIIDQAKSAGRVTNEGIAQIHEVGVDDGLVWYSMELVEGRPLNRVIEDDGPLDVGVAMLVVERLSRALEAAHKAGIGDNDLRPGNIMVCPSGAVKLLDIGMGKILQEGRQAQEKAALVGNPAFMSPEQAQGEKTDLHSDIYSLGCILFYILTGRPPFEGRTPLDIARAHIEAPIPSVCEIDSRHPPELDGLLASMLAKNAEWRFADTSELLEEISNVREGLGTDRVRAEAQAAQALAKSVESAGRLKPAAQPAPIPKSPRTPTSTVAGARRSSRRTQAGRSDRAFRNRLVNLAVVIIVLMGVLIIGIPLAKKALQNLENGNTNEGLTGNGPQPSNGSPIEPIRSPRNGQTHQQTPENGQNTTGEPPRNQWSRQWQELEAQVGDLTAQSQWGPAEFLLQEFIGKIPEDQDILLRKVQNTLTRTRVKGQEWYQTQSLALADLAGNKRLERLRWLRAKVLAEERPHVNARYDTALAQVMHGLAKSRRDAFLAIQQGDLKDLPRIGEEALAATMGTPVEDLGRRFSAIASAAADAQWAGSLSESRDRILALSDDDPDALLAGGALLLAAQEIEPAMNLLVGRTALSQEPWRSRREALVRAQAVVLDFSSPTDLGFIRSDLGQVLLGQGHLTGPENEVVSLQVQAPLRGDTWEVGADLRVSAYQDTVASGLTLTILSGADPAIMVTMDREGITTRIESPEGTQTITNPSSDDVVRVRVIVNGGKADIYLGDVQVAASQPIKLGAESRVSIDATEANWKVESLQVLGPPRATL